MVDKDFKALHITATQEDVKGNGGKGVYVLLPGSPDRAKSISSKFDKVTKTLVSQRGHTMYIGYVIYNGKKIDIASVSSGMGTPSVEIIVTELIHLGVTVILRVGTAGGLQPEAKIGDIFIGTGAVRDETSSLHYVPIQFPAIANYNLIKTAFYTAKELNIKNVYSGIIHTKASLYAREFGYGPNKVENKKFKEKLVSYGVVASEMEASMLFVMGQYYKIMTGTIVVAIDSGGEEHCTQQQYKDCVNYLIDYGIEIIKRIEN